MLVGHRGAAGLYPENTLSGFERTLDLGVDGIELDVMTTADGVLCVHHDYRLNPGTARITAKQWINDRVDIPIRNLTFQALQAYDVGRLNPDTVYALRYPDQCAIDGEKIPALQEVIALLKERDNEHTKMWIEIKVSPDQPEMTPPAEMVVKQVLKTLHNEDFDDRTIVLSFNWSVLALIKKMAPWMPRAYLSVTAKWLDNIKLGQPGPSPWTAGINLDDYHGSIPHGIHAAGGKIWGAWYKQLTVKEVQTAHDLGLKVFAWFVDSLSDIRKFVNMGVDGIITNRPDRAKQRLSRI